MSEIAEASVYVVFWISILSLIVLFAGTPDFHDALLASLQCR